MTLTNEQKTQITCLYDAGLNNAKIAEQLMIHRNTVAKWLLYYTNNIPMLNKQRLISKPENDIVLEVLGIIMEHKYYSLRKIRESLKEKFKETTVSLKTIQIILKDSGYIYGMPPLRFPLSEEHKKRRYNYAIKHRLIDWTKVDFTDEVSIWRIKRQHRWYDKNDVYDNDLQFKHESKRNAWGMISYDTKKLFVFTDNMNADIYVTILRNNYLPIYNDTNHMIYDNDPKHTSNKAKKFLSDNKIKCIDFPPYSPDLNPIENIWGQLKHEYTTSEVYKQMSFDDAIYKIWDSIDQQTIKNTIDKVKTNIELVIKNKGGYISK